MSLNLIFFIIIIGGWLFGKAFDTVMLPQVLGMTIFGIAISFFRENIPNILWELAPFLKSFALIVILLKAGLSIKRETLSKIGITALLMSLIPCLLEGIALTFLFQWIGGFDFITAGIIGFMISAVSPAVVIPSMLNLKEEGYGQKNEVPTTILAGASLDNVFVITILLTFINLGKGGEINYLESILSIFKSIILGILPGILLGFLLVLFFKYRHHKVKDAEKVLIVIGLSFLLLQIGDLFQTAALLGIMTLGFIILEKADYVAEDLSSKLSKIWIFAEIILFVLVGMSFDVNVALPVSLKGILIITLGLIARSVGVLIATIFSPFSFKEKVFCIISYIPKATVQAAFGSVPLAMGIANGELILAYAVLSKVFTAPLGLIGLRIFGKRLLGD